MTIRIKLRRDTAANWTSINPVLALGEPGLETDTRKVKYGDGTTAWTSLSYSAGDANFSGDYTALTNKPTIPDVQIQSDWTQSDNALKDFIKNKPALFSGSYADLSSKPSIPAAQIQSDWTQATNTALDFIKNKPTLVTNLDSLSDVTITTASSGQVLKYNGTTWINDTDSTGGGGGASTGNITFSNTTMASTNGNVKIGFSPTASPAVEFTFATSGNLVLPQGTILSETANSTTITPPNALAGQGLVVRLTVVQGIISDHPGGFTDGDTITLTVTPDYSSAPVTGTLDYTFTGATSIQLGRALTGTLTFDNASSMPISWTIPVSSTMTTFTVTIGNASGFTITSVDNTLTLTTTGSTEDHHVHLIAGDPSITDIYLGDDDQYVKIEKNGGNVVIGTDENNNQWTFGTNGGLTFPGDYYIGGGEGALGIASPNHIIIVANAGINSNNWFFEADGTTTFPDNTISNPESLLIKSGEDTAQVGSIRTIATDSNEGTGAGVPSEVDVAFDNTIIPAYHSNGSTITFANGDIRTITAITVEGAGYLKIAYSGTTTTSSPEFPIILKTANYAAATTAPEWTFGTDGMLTLPQGSAINETAGVSTNIIVNGRAWAFNVNGDLTLPPSGDIKNSTGASVLGYTLPTASTTVLGGVKVDGTTISVNDGVISSAGLIWTISASGSSAYVFSGPGIVAGNTDNPVLYLYRGFTYTFVNTTASSHPFAIRLTNGGADYTSEVTGSQTGTQTFTVPMNAPSTLYYQCTIHAGMGNTIMIV